MNIPVTSTKVATNGAEVTAGSKPTFDIINGNMDPLKLPNRTTPIKLIPTVKDCRKTVIVKGSPLKTIQVEITTVPIIPRTAPNSKPDISSLLRTIHQSDNLRSSVEMARIISVAACEPEFPPLEIIMGIKSASTAALASVSSKPAIAVTVNICPKKSNISQPTRLRTISEMSV